MRKTIPEADVLALQQAVEGLHGCMAKHRDWTLVRETFQGKTAWMGNVHAFDLHNHPSASVCYAWYEPVEDSDKRCFYAVLQEGPVKSAADAVRATIVQSYRESH